MIEEHLADEDILQDCKCSKIRSTPFASGKVMKADRKFSHRMGDRPASTMGTNCLFPDTFQHDQNSVEEQLKCRICFHRCSDDARTLAQDYLASLESSTFMLHFVSGLARCCFQSVGNKFGL